ncbi:ALDH-like protein [Hesseltinella vesiculosa]|uniref:ALDH-like protein n=1 Tax=Hesseltinella vesiculosa TaxID=101127 RepID=A0A1X2G503_9FUNG|nr:ALDH-like protein [Hesseltinella vesiculosa]
MMQGVDPVTVHAAGENNREDLFIAPTVVAPVPAKGHPLMEDELFGPYLPIVPVDDVDHAIDIINMRDHPLALYVFGDNKKQVDKLIDNTRSGGVLVNDVMIHVAEHGISFGGVGPSGMGIYHGDNSFNTFVHERSVMFKPSGMEKVLAARYPPYTDDKVSLIRVLFAGLPAAIHAKFIAIFKFIVTLRRVFSS